MHSPLSHTHYRPHLPRVAPRRALRRPRFHQATRAARPLPQCTLYRANGRPASPHSLTIGHPFDPRERLDHRRPARRRPGSPPGRCVSGVVGLWRSRSALMWPSFLVRILSYLVISRDRSHCRQIERCFPNPFLHQLLQPGRESKRRTGSTRIVYHRRENVRGAAPLRSTLHRAALQTGNLVRLLVALADQGARAC